MFTYVCESNHTYMDSKLTLSIDKNLIEKSKMYAKEKGRSLSDLVENYLKLITREKTTTAEIELTPIVKSLLGSFKVPKDFDYKKILREELQKKHV